jgi:hypothetical protein
MKKIFISLALTLSFSALADIRLSAGESIYIGGEVVRCGGGSQTNYAQLANLPWNQLEAMLRQGVGSCRLESMGGMLHFYSSRDRGVPVNLSMQPYVRDAIKKGDCE